MQHRFFRVMMMTATTVSRRACGVGCGFLALFALSPRTEASTHIWTGAGSNALWSNAANWSGGRPTSNEPDWTTVQFGSNTTSTCDISGLVVDVITFTGGGNTINGTTALRIDGDNAPVNVLSTAGNNKFGSTLPVIFSVFTPYINVPAGTLTIAGNCSGTPGFRKLGAGTLTLTGNNTFAGLTEVAAGTLVLNSSVIYGGLAGSVTVGLGTGAPASAVLSMGQAVQIAQTAAVTVNSDGFFQMNAMGQTIGALTIHDGRVDQGGSLLTVKGSMNMTGGRINGTKDGILSFESSRTVTVTSSAATGGAVIESPIAMQGILTFAVATGPYQPELTLQGAISEISTGAALYKTGAGTLMLEATEDNTYTGETWVQSGVLALGSASDFAVPGMLQIGMGQGAPAESAVVQLRSSDEIADTAQVIVNRDGVLDLNGNRETVNVLDVVGGTVRVGDQSLTVKGSAGLSMFGGTIASSGTGLLSLNGTLTVNNGVNDVNGAVIATPVLLQSTLTLDVTRGPRSPDLTLSGVVSGAGASYGLTKNDAGTLLMTADNTYTGTTRITTGDVVINGSQGGSAVDLEGSGVLSGSGVVGAVTTGTGATGVVAVGSALDTVQHLGNLRVNGNATLAGTTLIVRLDDNNSGTQKSDILEASGSLDLTGVTVAPDPAGAFSAGPYVIAKYGQFGGTLTGTFAHVPSGYSVDYAYNDGTSNRNIALTVTNPYFIWAANYGLDPATTAVFGADPDHDGLANGIEFVLGTSPLDPSGGTILPVATVTGTDFIFTYRRNGSAVYLHPVMQVSENLTAGSWTTVTSGISVATNFYGGGVDKVTVTVPMAGRKQLFGRVSVDAP